MQRNQAEAMVAVKGYETVLKARIQAHGGDLLQTYGDGSLPPILPFYNFLLVNLLLENQRDLRL